MQRSCIVTGQEYIKENYNYKSGKLSRDENDDLPVRALKTSDFYRIISTPATGTIPSLALDQSISIVNTRCLILRVSTKNDCVRSILKHQTLYTIEKILSLNITLFLLTVYHNLNQHFSIDLYRSIHIQLGNHLRSFLILFLSLSASSKTLVSQWYTGSKARPKLEFKLTSYSLQSITLQEWNSSIIFLKQFETFLSGEALVAYWIVLFDDQ